MYKIPASIDMPHDNGIFHTVSEIEGYTMGTSDKELEEG